MSIRKTLSLFCVRGKEGVGWIARVLGFWRGAGFTVRWRTVILLVFCGALVFWWVLFRARTVELDLTQGELDAKVEEYLHALAPEVHIVAGSARGAYWLNWYAGPWFYRAQLSEAGLQQLLLTVDSWAGNTKSSRYSFSGKKPMDRLPGSRIAPEWYYTESPTVWLSMRDHKKEIRVEIYISEHGALLLRVSAPG